MPSLLLDHLTRPSGSTSRGGGGDGVRRGRARNGEEAGQPPEPGSQGVGRGHHRKLCCGSGMGDLQTTVPHLSEAAEVARDKQLLKLWSMSRWAVHEGLDLGNFLI